MSRGYHLFPGICICGNLFKISFILHKSEIGKTISTYHILGTSVSMNDKLIRLVVVLCKQNKVQGLHSFSAYSAGW